jgi:hypothetical protein
MKIAAKAVMEIVGMTVKSIHSMDCTAAKPTCAVEGATGADSTAVKPT